MTDKLSNNGKSLISSKTIWGALVAGVPAFLSLIANNVDSLQALAASGVLGPQGVAAAAVIGAVVAAYGRATAKEKITTTLPE